MNPPEDPGPPTDETPEPGSDLEQADSPVDPQAQPSETASDDTQPLALGDPAERPAESPWAPPGPQAQQPDGPAQPDLSAQPDPSAQPDQVAQPEQAYADDTFGAHPPAPFPTTALPAEEGAHAAAPTRERRRPGLVGVGAVAVVLGLLGGAGGAAIYDRVSDDTSDSGQVSGGLPDVDTVSLPPVGEDGSVAAVAQAMLPSTVQIFAEFEGQEGGATGSGFVLDKQGHIVTNNHVVAEADEDDGPIEIVDQDGNRYDAKVVGRSPDYDIAVLYAKDAVDLAPAALGASEQLRVGDGVVAIGAPLGLGSTVTSGIVSALERPVTTGDSADESSYISAVQTDAAINPGNSGGPLVNLRGQVVGVNSAIATNGGGTVSGQAGNIGVGFAIPVEQVKVTVDQILRTGDAEVPVIGAQVRTGGASTGEGAVISEIIDGTPAADAGLQEDDVVTAVDGERVFDGIGLIVMIRSHQPGDTIKFTVSRGNDEQDVSLTLEARED